ncbi:GFA family protein [Geminicoccaceae bacterium 1502E]|nr:GFA family protein [Geminicoccaceae bacterium 1502E]
MAEASSNGRGLLGLTGGCLCGAVRYRTAARPLHTSFCHCRMCQQATGGPFAVWCAFPAEGVAWIRGSPRLFRSSALAERGFCADCGTPLLFRYVEQPERLSLAAGSLDDPGQVTPERHWGIESRLPWPALDDGLPGRRTEDDPAFQELMRKALE